MGLRHFSISHIFFLLIIGLHLGRHLEYIEMLNDARVASLGYFKDNICTTRINKEKKFKIKFPLYMRPSQGFWGTGEKSIYFRGTGGTKAKF